jgi:hypothetical protein
MTNPAYTNAFENSPAARHAALGATRQMIADDSFAALVAALVDCRAVPRNVMASVLDGLADKLIAKARGEMESDVIVFPSECFDRARDLSAQAAMLRRAS